MSRYIDADKLIDDLEHDIAIDQDHILYVGIDMREKELIQFDKDCKQNCIDMLSKAPAADVRENVKGEWLPHPNKDFREWDVCSACGVGCKRREYGLGIAGMEYMTEYNYPYCPNCGADMRSKE